MNKPRVITIRLTPQEHLLVCLDAIKAKTSIQKLCHKRILEAITINPPPQEKIKGVRPYGPKRNP